LLSIGTGSIWRNHPYALQRASGNKIPDVIKNEMEVYNEALNEKYLCIPLDVGTATNGAFKYLKDRVWSRVEGWLV